MSRQVVLDTETTGLEPLDGHRIIEIGCVEIVDRRRSGRTFHHYLCPGRAVDPGAVAVHGLTDEFLADKPRFADIAEAFLSFVAEAELVIHNAPFDLGFLDAELERLAGEGGSGPRRLSGGCAVTDSLVLARRLHPGQRNSLDALCKRYGVDNTQRDRHGALLDAELLADVYLAMTGGQADLALAAEPVRRTQSGAGPSLQRPEGLSLRVVRPSEAELQAHRERLEAIDAVSGGSCLWLHPPEPATGG